MSDDSMLDDFSIEAQELFDEAEESLMNIEEGGSFKENYNSIFRAFHSIKGSAGMIGVEPLQEHMHHLESLFQKLKDADSMPAGLVDYLLRGNDGGRKILLGEEIIFEHKELESFYDDNTSSSPDRDIQQQSNKKDSKLAETTTEKVVGKPDKISETNALKLKIFCITGTEGTLESRLTNEELTKITISTSDEFPKGTELLSFDLLVSGPNNPSLPTFEKERPPWILLYDEITLEQINKFQEQGISSFIDINKSTYPILDFAKYYRSKKVSSEVIKTLLYQFSELDDYLTSENKQDTQREIRKKIKMFLGLKKLIGA